MRLPQKAGTWPLALILVGGMLVGSSWSDAVQEGEGGALVAAACTGSTPVPNGATLYALMGQAFCALPASTAAGRLAGLSGLCAVLSMLFLFGLVRRCTHNAWAGGVAALTLGTGDIFWRMASQASLIPLALLLCLAALYCAVRGAQASPSSLASSAWSLGAGLCASLAAGTHPGALVAAPVCLLAAVWPLTPCLGLASRALFLGAGAGAGVLITGGVLPMPGPSVEPLSRLGELITALPTQLGGVLWPLAVLGLGVLCFHAAGRPLGRPLRGRLRRDLAGAMAALPLLAGPGLAVLTALKGPLDPARLARPHFALTAALLCLPLGVGLALLDESLLRKRAATEEAGPSRGGASIWHGLVLVVLGAYALVAFPRARLDNDFIVEDFARNCLTSAERDSTLIISGVTQRSIFRFAQQVLRIRPDVKVVDPALLPGTPDPLRLIQNALRQGRPVQVAGQVEARRIRNAFGVHAAGPLLRIQSPDRRPPSTHTVAQLNQRLFRGFSKRGKIPHEPDPLRATELLEPYARAWRQLGRALFRQGQTREAFKALVRAQRWAPWLETPAWFGLRKGNFGK